MDYILGGVFTVDDYKLYDYMRYLHETENINIEPSACAAFEGCIKFENTNEGKRYIKDHNLQNAMQNAVHIAWATGGSLVPDEINKQFLQTRIYKEEK